MASSEPMLIAVAVVQRGALVLIGQRPPGVPLGGLWEFPGGKILPGETPEQAACRECREETGLEIRVLRPLEIVEHSYPHGRVRLHFLLAEPLDSDGQPGASFQWVARSDLADYPFPPANAVVLRDLVHG